MRMLYVENSSDLVIPFLQEFLSNVEKLELYSELIGKLEFKLQVPYLLLYIIVTSNQPRLKHLTVHDNEMFEDNILAILYSRV